MRGKRTITIVVVCLIAAGVGLALIYTRQVTDDRAFSEAARVEGSVGSDYESALRAYERYINRHPRGRHVDAARVKIEKELPARIEGREWDRAVGKNSIEGYESYLERFVDGAHVGEAGRELAALREATRTEKERVLAQARASFGRGLVVHLYDPVPSATTQEKMQGGEFALRYLISESAARRRAALAVRSVDRDGRAKALSLFNSSSPDWSQREGVCSFRVSAFADDYADIMEQALGTRQGTSAGKPVRIEVVLVTATESAGGSLMIDGDSRPLSNVLAIPVR